MRKSHLLAGAAVLALAAAHAAQAGSLYVFGDSLSDTGNLYKLIGQPPPPYYEGRFSNGPVWVEYLPGLTGLSFTTANDYAYGGAYTGDLTYGGTNYGDNIEDASIPGANLPGVNDELTQFAATGQRFGRNDVVTLWIGANNYFFYSNFVEADPADATAIVTQAVTTTVGQLTSDATTLIGLGARTLIVPNLPDLGVTPDYNSSAQSAALGDAFSINHNTVMPVYMEMLHQQTGANIIVLNEEQLLNTVIANPAAYGFSNVTQACIDVATCVTGSTATQNTYLFWDGVHPTTAAQDIIAKYAAASLTALDGNTVPAQLGTTGAQDFLGLLNTRLDALHAGATGFSYNVNGASGGMGNAGPLGVFVSGGGGFGNRQNNGNTLGFTYANAATALGVDYRFSPAFTAGLALGYGDNSATVNSGGGKVQETALTAGVYALATAGNAYAKVYGGYSDDWYKTSRTGVMSGGVTGKPQGAVYMASAELGYALPARYGVTLTPSVALAYTNTSLQAYTESGDPLLTQAVASQGYQQVLLTPGVTAVTALRVAGVELCPYVSAAAQIRVSGAYSNFSSVFTDEPGVTLTDAYPSQPTAWALLGAGASARLGYNLSASAGLTATAFKTHGNDLLASGAVNWQF
jgi:outer membrane lipase/esterase